MGADVPWSFSSDPSTEFAYLGAVGCRMAARWHALDFMRLTGDAGNRHHCYAGTKSDSKFAARRPSGGPPAAKPMRAGLRRLTKIGFAFSNYLPAPKSTNEWHRRYPSLNRNCPRLSFITLRCFIRALCLRRQRRFNGCGVCRRRDV